MQRCSGVAGGKAGCGLTSLSGQLGPPMQANPSCSATPSASLSARRHLGYDGGKIAGLYDLEETLGRGHFAVVKLARHVFTGEKVAVKVIDKSKLDEVSRAHLFQEVRCMKLVQHPNVVRLYEVIDTQTKLYLILELADGGDLYDYIMRHETGLSEDLAREYFRQIVRAISYCHRLHVVHRDLKPENVVFFERLGMVKLTDFGFSNRFNPGQKLETSCGSLAYSAPEILLGDSYDAPAVDIWSLGVILFMLVCGQAPFQEANDSETLTMIMDCKYTVPAHVSEPCKRLISKMLLREPEMRATLEEIGADPWLAESNPSHQQPADFLPLVSREHLSDEDHALIIQKMVNGNIASKEEILEALDKNEYNHITATYFLLAERKLRAHRQEQAQIRLRQCSSASSPQHANKPALGLKVVVPPQLGAASDVADTAILAVTRTGEQQNFRTRKCSIVQEEEDEDEMSSCSGREELTPPHSSLNRRGSRSEGKINIAIQERLKEAELRKEKENALAAAAATAILAPSVIKSGDLRPRSAVETSDPKAPAYIPGSTKWRVSSKTVKVTRIQTSVITESSTVPNPITTQCEPVSVPPRCRTLPNPITTRTKDTQTLNEIFEDSETLSSTSSRPIRAGYHQSQQQRRTKFHKARTASCSSSDASDDDSESRKKRAHKLATPGVTKPLTQRRDSHDDSSDSQDPSCSGGGGGGGGGGNLTTRTTAPPTTHNGGSGNTEGRDIADTKQSAGRRHRTGRRRAGETRLRESQSLNRITEVQEAEAPTTNKPCRPVIEEEKSKENNIDERVELEKENHLTTTKPAGNDLKASSAAAPPSTEKHAKTGKKIRLLGRYFQIHKKLCIPLPLFGRGRLYKAQSCGSIVRERVAPLGAGAPNGDRWCKSTDAREAALEAVLPLATCPAITICRIHLGDVSKCCNLC